MGDAVILDSTLNLLRGILEKVEFTLLSYNPTIDAKRCDVKVLEAIGISWKSFSKTIWLLLRSLLWAIAQRIAHLKIEWLIDDPILQEYANADVIVVRGGDVLTEDYGTPSLVSHLLSIWIAVLMQRPIILLGHTIGPFGKIKYLVKTILNEVDLIILREKNSRKYLRLYNISKPF